jgi:AraC-like DNA-binding protein
MDFLYRIHDVNQFNRDNNHKTLHPLVSVVDFSKAAPRNWGDYQKIMFQYGLYCVYLKDVKCGDLRYGRHYYDYQAGTLAFFAPGQVIEIENPGMPYQPMGYGLVVHPDFLLGTQLGKNMASYKYFSYESNEALHLSDDERKLILGCFEKIDFELHQPIDKHSKKLIASTIELFLDYCLRFYDRQFITREVANKGVLEKFEQLLNDYFSSKLPQTVGLPSVAYFAHALHLSPNYFGDLIKKETGQSAKEYLQNKTIEVAKTSVFSREKSINEIAFELGFKYPQHFSRLFKQKVGLTPNEFRMMN